MSRLVDRRHGRLTRELRSCLLGAAVLCAVVAPLASAQPRPLRTLSGGLTVTVVAPANGAQITLPAMSFLTGTGSPVLFRWHVDTSGCDSRGISYVIVYGRESWVGGGFSPLNFRQELGKEAAIWSISGGAHPGRLDWYVHAVCSKACPPQVLCTGDLTGDSAHATVTFVFERPDPCQTGPCIGPPTGRFSKEAKEKAAANAREAAEERNELKEAIEPLCLATELTAQQVPDGWEVPLPSGGTIDPKAAAEAAKTFCNAVKNGVRVVELLKELSYKLSAKDPPDPHFGTIAQPHSPSFKPVIVSRVFPLMQQAASAVNRLLSIDAQSVGIADALYTTMNRIQGAKRAGDTRAAARQVHAARGYSNQLGALELREASQRVMTAASLSAAGFGKRLPAIFAGVSLMNGEVEFGIALESFAASMTHGS